MRKRKRGQGREREGKEEKERKNEEKEEGEYAHTVCVHIQCVIIYTLPIWNMYCGIPYNNLSWLIQCC